MKTKQIWILAVVAIALSGPNAPAAYNWYEYRHGSTPFESPAVSRDVVAFTSRAGERKGSFYPASMGVFHGHFGAVDVRVGGAAPSGTFTNFGPARVSAFSTAGISGDFNNNGAVDAADYVLWRNAGPLHNDLTPGVQPEDYDTWRANFGRVGDIASAYTVAFHGTYDDPPKSGIFTTRGGQLTTIAKVGDSMPSTGSPIVHVYPDLAISGNTVVFGATDAGGTSAILMSSGGELTTVAKTGDMTSLGPLESLVPSPAISDNSVAFAATAGDGTRGIFASSGGELTTIFKVGDPAPVGVFTSFFQEGISMGTNGKVAFLANYDGGTKSGIFTAGGGEITTVVQTGDVLPGIGASYLLGGASMAGDEVAFYALVPGGPSAPYPQSTFFLRKGSEPIQRIASVAELPGTSGGSPASIGMGRFGFSGYRLAFSFDIQINDGVGIIAVRTIPEPASWLLAALGTSAVLLVGTRRRNTASRAQWVRTLVLRRCSTTPLLHLLWIGFLFGLTAPPVQAQSADLSNGVSADGLGNVYISGLTRVDFVGTTFVSKYNAAGNLQWTALSRDFLIPEPVSWLFAALALATVLLVRVRRDLTRPTLVAIVTIVACMLPLTATDAAEYAFINIADTTTAAPSGTFDGFDSSRLSFRPNDVYLDLSDTDVLVGEQISLDITAIVPEPATLAMLGLAFLALGGSTRLRSAADSLGNVYIAGGFGGHSPIYPGYVDAFLTKYDAAGNLQWIRQLGTSNDVSISGISADGLGNVYLAGASDNAFVPIIAGLVMMMLGLGLGVTMVLLPLGLPLGLAGLAVLVWGLAPGWRR